MSQKTARSEARSEAQTQLFSNLPTCPQEIPLPSGSTAEPFGCHNIFRKAVFPLWPIVFFVTCHNSLPPPPHPHPLSGAQIRSITAPGQCMCQAGHFQQRMQHNVNPDASPFGNGFQFCCTKFWWHHSAPPPPPGRDPVTGKTISLPEHTCVRNGQITTGTGPSVLKGAGAGG